MTSRDCFEAHLSRKQKRSKKVRSRRKYRRKNNPSAEKGREHCRRGFELGGGPNIQKFLDRKQDKKGLAFYLKDLETV